MGMKSSCCVKHSDSSITNNKVAGETPGTENYCIPDMHHKIHYLIQLVYTKRQYSVHSISLNGKIIGEEGGRYLAVVLPYYNHITELLLCNCGIGTMSCQALSFPLKELVNLKNFDISNNELGPEGAQKISEGLLYMQALDSLNLENTKLGPRGVVVISESLLSVRNLQVLQLGNNDIGPAGVAGVAKVFQDFVSLKCLELHENRIMPQGAFALAAGMKHLDQLEKLTLGRNCIQNAGMLSVLGALPRTLSELRVESNGLDDEAVLELAARLPGFPGMSILMLDENDITEKGARAIAEAISGMNLTILGLVDCSVYHCRKELTLAGLNTDILF